MGPHFKYHHPRAADRRDPTKEEHAALKEARTEIAALRHRVSTLERTVKAATTLLHTADRKER